VGAPIDADELRGVQEPLKRRYQTLAQAPTLSVSLDLRT